jgi:hypothetical protein
MPRITIKEHIMWISSFIIYYNKYSGKIEYKSKIVADEVDGKIITYFSSGSAHPSIFKDLKQIGIDESDAIILGRTIGEKNDYHVEDIRINSLSYFRFDMSEMARDGETLGEGMQVFLQETEQFIKNSISSEMYFDILKHKIKGLDSFILNENRFGGSKSASVRRQHRAMERGR